MPSPEAAALADAHRLAQARIGVETVRTLIAIWPLLDLVRLDATFPVWFRTVAPTVQRQRVRSARLAASYYVAARTIDVGASDFLPVLADAVPPEQLATSMIATGPARLKRHVSAEGVTLRRHAEAAMTSTARAAMRHALNGGRETIRRSIEADSAARGHARVASSKCCSFCAMLVSRGAVYSADTVGFRSHDGCACSERPVFRDEDDTPPFAELWETSTAGLSGDAARTAFRSAVDAQRN